MGIFLDTSNSALADSSVFIYVQDFITRIIARLDVAPDRSNIGVLQFASVPSITQVNPQSVSETIFSFSIYATKYEMYSAIYLTSALTDSKATSPDFG